ncbi:hypothetical protein ACNF49_30490 [Actinomadura sp. ATCC 39365]
MERTSAVARQDDERQQRKQQGVQDTQDAGGGSHAHQRFQHADDLVDDDVDPPGPVLRGLQEIMKLGALEVQEFDVGGAAEEFVVGQVLDLRLEPAGGGTGPGGQHRDADAGGRDQDQRRYGGLDAVGGGTLGEDLLQDTVGGQQAERGRGADDELAGHDDHERGRVGSPGQPQADADQRGQLTHDHAEADRQVGFVPRPAHAVLEAASEDRIRGGFLHGGLLPGVVGRGRIRFGPYRHGGGSVLSGSGSSARRRRPPLARVATRAPRCPGCWRALPGEAVAGSRWRAAGRSRRRAVS